MSRYRVYRNAEGKITGYSEPYHPFWRAIGLILLVMLVSEVIVKYWYVALPVALLAGFAVVAVQVKRG